MPFSIPELLILAAVGLAAGGLGGLLGIGGSIVMIPVITLAFDQDQHVAQAAAMIVNVFVAVPSVYRHHRVRAVPWPSVRRMLPAGLVMIVVGVGASNYFPATLLERVFGVFLVYVIFVNVRKLLRSSRGEGGSTPRDGWMPLSVCAGIMGFAAGLLGIGGGIIVVPLLQHIARLPLRQCIAASAAAMCATAPLGALRKNMTLPDVLGDVTTGWGGLPTPVGESLLIAVCLAPTAILGGLLGAGLTHVLPLRVVRGALVVLLTAASVKLLGL